MLPYVRVIFVLFYALATSGGASAESGHPSATRRREPNNVQCFKNSDCLSDCCISNNGWVGVCVGKPQIGQICGLFTTANNAPPMNNGANNPWSWSYGNVLGGMLMNQGGGGGSSANAPVPQQSPTNRQGSNTWVADLNALLTNTGSSSTGRDPYDASGLLQAFHQGGGGAAGGHHGTGGYNMNNFDLSSLKYGNKFGRRSSAEDLYG